MVKKISRKLKWKTNNIPTIHPEKTYKEEKNT